jgi:hypothetical protein
MLRFKLRSLIFGITLLAVPIAVLASMKYRVERKWREEERLVNEFVNVGATIEYQTDHEHVSPIIRLLCDPGIFNVVYEVYVDSCPVPYSLLEKLPEFQSVRIVSLKHTVADDAILNRLSGHSRIRVIYLSGTKVTAEGVAGFRNANPKVMVVEEDFTRTRVFPDYLFDGPD